MPKKRSRRGLGTRRAKRGKAPAAEVVVAGPPLPPPEAFAPVREFYTALRGYEEGGRLRRTYVGARYEELFKEPPPEGSHWKLAEHRIGYELQYRGFKEAGCLELLPAKVIDNRRSAALMEVEAYDCDSLLRGLLECRIAAEKRSAMARSKTGKKAKGEKRETISATIIKILGGKKVPSNEEIVEQVQKAFPDSKFDAKHLSWYKNRYVQGLLPGQDGKAKTIAQAKSESMPGRKKAAAKKGGKSKAPARKKATSKKKKVVRRKAS